MGCYCGQYRYAIQGEIESSALCHRENSRRAIGAYVVPWLLMKKTVFKLLRGDLSSHLGCF
ncbi:MAG: hypothetical protein ACO3ZW_04650 [Opitutales bacterium]